ncbi:iron dicitrate transport regulator FecR [Bremerella cremea]|uniref:Iron dicitrate transport regulator FecR n=1 Tax=Bremerella cremea TaxID=1031537 RepID=A0A368KRE6_9BACT|nr:FecR family protein [Bremerella cremea]RCS49458.1 iron dicitrate transport regulator FecR [Bremerella cremea]
MSAEIDDLIERWLEGSLNAEQEKELQNWLQSDPQNMQSFTEANIRHQILQDAIRSELVTNEIKGTSSASAKRSTFAWKQSLAIATGIAACLLIVLFVLRPNKNGNSERTPFVTVAMVEDPGSDLTVGDRISAQAIIIQTGLVRLQFDDGVEVTLQGPARYELISPGRTRLDRGLLTATVPPGAEGFKVDTPMAEVIDLGTAFGIQLDDDGRALISVFDGEVEVHSGDDSETRLVREGEAVEVASLKTILESKFDTSPYEKLWPASSGIAGSSGAFKYAPPWPRRMGRIQSDENLMVLQEGYAQTLDAPLTVNVVAPGTYRHDSQLIDQEIPAGTRVKSFLLQFRPANDNEAESSVQRSRPNPDDIKRITGDITFDRPVLGLIVRGDDLRSSDGRFSVRGGQVPQKGRSLELFGTPRDDVLTLSKDRRTISLDLAAFGQFNDQVRVIVDESLEQ